jgi:hypothetical protein
MSSSSAREAAAATGATTGREEVGFYAAFLQIEREREGRGEIRLPRPKTRFGLGSSSGSENSNLESEGMYEIDDLSS